MTVMTSTCMHMHAKIIFCRFLPRECENETSLIVCEKRHHHSTQTSPQSLDNPWSHFLRHRTHSFPHSSVELLTLQLLVLEGLQCQVPQPPVIFCSKSVYSCASPLSPLHWRCTIKPESSGDQQLCSAM